MKFSVGDIVYSEEWDTLCKVLDEPQDGWIELLLLNIPNIYPIFIGLVADTRKLTPQEMLKYRLTGKLMKVGDIVSLNWNEEVGHIDKMLPPMSNNVMWYRVKKYNGGNWLWCTEDEITPLTDTEILKYRLAGKI